MNIRTLMNQLISEVLYVDNMTPSPGLPGLGTL